MTRKGGKAKTTPASLTTLVTLVVVLLFLAHSTEAFFQSLKLPSFPFFNIEPANGRPPTTKNVDGNVALEKQLMSSISNTSRLSNAGDISNLVKALEDSRSGVEQPAISPKVYGRWKLIHTSNANTSSPIQRKAVDASKFDIYQDIFIRDTDNKLIVSQVVKFSDSAQLKVDALASTSAYPIPELTSREEDGKILGLNILGVSLVGKEASTDPTRPDSRINFVFDEGNFDFDGFKIPYPVPFRWPLFRDAVKGWIDITVRLLLCLRVHLTGNRVLKLAQDAWISVNCLFLLLYTYHVGQTQYLSDRMRIARGNKGTTFVLVKEEFAD